MDYLDYFCNECKFYKTEIKWKKGVCTHKEAFGEYPLYTKACFRIQPNKNQH